MAAFNLHILAIFETEERGQCGVVQLEIWLVGEDEAEHRGRRIESNRLSCLLGKHLGHGRRCRDDG